MITEKDSRITKVYSWLNIMDNEVDKFLQLDGKIIECIWDPAWKTFLPKVGSENWEGHWEAGGWKYFRTRSDKKYPNDQRMVDSVVRSIEENITKEKVKKKYLILEHFIFEVIFIILLFI